MINSKDRLALYDLINRSIGDTPLREIRNIDIPNGNKILYKAEYLNPSGSHYDRVYYNLFYYYEIVNKTISPGITPIIENTSGCAGAACAYIGKLLGYDVTIVAPSNLPENRMKNILKHDANLIISEGEAYVLGTKSKLEEILSQDRQEKKTGDPSRYFCLNHSQIDESVKAMTNCGKEIIAQMPNQLRNIDTFISAVGNGTSMLGVGKILKKKYNTEIIAIDPNEAPVVQSLIKGCNISNPRLHELYGIGAWGIDFPFIKKELIKDVSIVKQNEWEHALRLLIEKEELHVGHTSAASLSVALKYSETVKNKVILILFYDSLGNY